MVMSISTELEGMFYSIKIWNLQPKSSMEHPMDGWYGTNKRPWTHGQNRIRHLSLPGGWETEIKPVAGRNNSFAIYYVRRRILKGELSPQS